MLVVYLFFYKTRYVSSCNSIYALNHPSFNECVKHDLTSEAKHQPPFFAVISTLLEPETVPDAYMHQIYIHTYIH